MVALGDGVYARDLLSIGLDWVLRFGSRSRIFLGYPCLGQGRPIDLTCTTTQMLWILGEILTYMLHRCRLYNGSNWKPYDYMTYRTDPRLVTYLDLAGAERTASIAAGSEATAATAVLPDPTSVFTAYYSPAFSSGFVIQLYLCVLLTHVGFMHVFFLLQLPGEWLIAIDRDYIPVHSANY